VDDIDYNDSLDFWSLSMGAIRSVIIVATSVGLVLCQACDRSNSPDPLVSIDVSKKAPQPEVVIVSELNKSKAETPRSQAGSKSVKIVSKLYEGRSKNGFCQFKIDYPELVSLPDRNTKAEINQYIFNDLVKTDNPDCADNADLSQLGKDESYSIDLNYKVTYNQGSLLSVKVSGLGTSLRNGTIDAAHPSKIYKSYNYDLKTGKLLRFQDLFVNDRGFISKIDQSIARQYPNINPISCDNTNLHPDICKGDYEFYISGNNLVIFNIFDNFVAGSVEAEIKLSELKDSIDPNSLLQDIVK